MIKVIKVETIDLTLQSCTEHLPMTGLWFNVNTVETDPTITNKNCSNLMVKSGEEGGRWMKIQNTLSLPTALVFRPFTHMIQSDL